MFFRKRHAYLREVPCSPLEFARILNDAIGNQAAVQVTPTMTMRQNAVAGWADESTVKLHLPESETGGENTVFSGTLMETRRGALLDGHFHLNTSSRVFMCIWMSGVCLIGGGLTLLAAYGAVFGEASDMANRFIGPLVFAVFTIAMLALGSCLGRPEPEKIMKFLDGVLSENHEAIIPDPETGAAD